MKITIKQLETELKDALESARKYKDETYELRCSLNNSKQERDTIKQQLERQQGYIWSVDDVLKELRGILIAVKLPDDGPKKSIDFMPNDYYRPTNYEDRNRDFTIRDEIEKRLDYIQQSIGSIKVAK